jgi:hypothetical protein
VQIPLMSFDPMFRQMFYSRQHRRHRRLNNRHLRHQLLLENQQRKIADNFEMR